MKIGARLRKLRRMQSRSIYEIAAASKITPSLLSKIETGRSNPPLATLTRIAMALGVSPAALLTDDAERQTVYTPAAGMTRAKMTRTDKGYLFLDMCAGRHGKRVETYLFEAEKGKVKPSPLSHPGEEFVYVLEGTMLYTVGAVQYRLSSGDSLYFDAEEDHDIEPVSQKVRYIAVFAGRREGKAGGKS